ncbi:hypothetical protein [Clostridium sp. LP20]|uniref:hypothetical protein n=1 Tax=Clostridium sp. LP20 TaxID=3418665 RepID=UPI003EE45951
MNIKQLKDKTMQIIREYSTNGSIIGKGGNADYLLSVPTFLSEAENEISNKRPILDEMELKEPIRATSKYIRFKKPERFKKVSEITCDDIHIGDYDVSVNEICIPKSYMGRDLVLTYIKSPKMFDNTVDDSYILEIDEDLHYITAYKAAGSVIMDENQEMANSFLKEYQSLLGSIDSISTKKINIVDVYGCDFNGEE